MPYSFAVASDKSFQYRLGSNADMHEDPDSRELLRDIFASETHVTLKRMSQGNRDAYADAIANAGRNPAKTIRREVGKWIAGTGDTTLVDSSGDERPFESVNHFMSVVPAAVVVDIHFELLKVPTSGN